MLITGAVSYNGAVGCCRHGVRWVSEYGEWWELGSGKLRKTDNKCFPIATLSTMNPTWTGLKSYPVLRGEKPSDIPSHCIFLVLQRCYIVYVGKDTDFKMDLATCASVLGVHLV